MIHQPALQTQKKEYGAELVFALNFADTLNVPNGYTEITKQNTQALEEIKGQFVLRSDAEGELAFQQIIPCIIFLDKKGKTLVHTDKNGKLSIFIWDILRPSDDLQNFHQGIIANGLARILDTETNFPYISKELPQKKAYIRDLASSFACYTGVLYEATIPMSQGKKLKIEGLKTTWMAKEDLVRSYSRFDALSKLIIAEAVV